MADITIYPLNDKPILVHLFTVDQDTTSAKFGKVIPLTIGPVTAFLSVSNAPNATTADPALNVTGQHVGKGVWLLVWDSAFLTTTTLATLTAGGYIIIEQPNGIRVCAQFDYSASRPATVA